MTQGKFKLQFFLLFTCLLWTSSATAQDIDGSGDTFPDVRLEIIDGEGEGIASDANVGEAYRVARSRAYRQALLKVWEQFEILELMLKDGEQVFEVIQFSVDYKLITWSRLPDGSVFFDFECTITWHVWIIE